MLAPHGRGPHSDSPGTLVPISTSCSCHGGWPGPPLGAAPGHSRPEGKVGPGNPGGEV